MRRFPAVDHRVLARKVIDGHRKLIARCSLLRANAGLQYSWLTSLYQISTGYFLRRDAAGKLGSK